MRVLSPSACEVLFGTPPSGIWAAALVGLVIALGPVRDAVTVP